MVSAAISLSDALAVAAAQYERMTGASVIVNAAGSDTLATQLVAGARADVFLSADTRQMERLERRGLVAGSPIDLFSNQLVAVVHRDALFAPACANGLRSESIRRIAVGDPHSVPAGVYAREYLQRQGVWSFVEDKLVPTRNVRAVLAAVAAGHADVGFVYRTDLAVSDAVVMAFAVPLEESPRIRYPGAVLSGARHAGEAHRFLTFLQSPAGRGVFERAGFVVMRPAEGS